MHACKRGAGGGPLRSAWDMIGKNKQMGGGGGARSCVQYRFERELEWELEIGVDCRHWLACILHLGGQVGIYFE